MLIQNPITLKPRNQNLDGRLYYQKLLLESVPKHKYEKVLAENLTLIMCMCVTRHAASARMLEFCLETVS